MIRGEQKVERLEEPEVLNNSKEIVFFKHNRAETHRDREGTQDLHMFKPDKIPVLRGGVGVKVEP